MIGEFVIVRTKNSGVHVGTLKESNGTAVLLTDTSRVWRWRGANSLHEMSLDGVDKDYSRISKQVPRILLTEAIEVIPCTEKAKKNLSQPRWAA